MLLLLLPSDSIGLSTVRPSAADSANLGRAVKPVNIINRLPSQLCSCAVVRRPFHDSRQHRNPTCLPAGCQYHRYVALEDALTKNSLLSVQSSSVASYSDYWHEVIYTQISHAQSIVCTSYGIHASPSPASDRCLQEQTRYETATRRPSCSRDTGGH
ncbi:hypothetical protein L227DRAFT_570445 [Lentinus tigrinus ALCF2SS1-6]|uniref:Uncharacterized protein n=1 Tax=Lentinus tigrinus ALCF2SS1-6 TaxID=1328759 RepID=A0A5C2SU28_9APHY|nr:hypothetical protein L227DRAFT_570445 [Lentinus tigrinus ALCF2SS1-6]